MKAVIFALLAIVLFQAASVSAQGRLFCDELCGLTDFTIDIPSFEADLWVADDITTTEFSGTKPTGFQLETVGGIRVNSGDEVSVTSETDVNISTPISGIFEVFGLTTTFNTGSSLSITANDDIRVDADLITLSTGTNTTGDIVLDSNLHTSFEGVQGIDISSLFRDVDFKAPSGHATFSSDIITFISGDTVDDQQLELNGGNIEIHTDGSFDVNAGTDLSITTLETIVLQSRSRDLTLEAFHTLHLDADHVNFESTSFFTATSLVGDINVSAGDTAGFYSHSNEFVATGVVSVSGANVDMFSTGDVSVGFPPLVNQQAPDVTVNADSATYAQSGTGTVTFKGPFFTLSAADLTTSAESLYLETGEGIVNSIAIDSGDSVAFSSAEDLRFDSHDINIDADSSLTVDAGDDIFMFSPVQPGTSVTLEATDGGASFSFSEDILIHGDNNLEVDADGSILGTAGGDYRAQASGVLVVTMDDQYVVSANDDIEVLNSHGMQLSTEGTIDVVASQGTASIVATHFDGLFEASDFTSEQANNFITSDNGSFDLHAGELSITSGTSLTLSATGNDDQRFTIVSGGVDMSGLTDTFSAAELTVVSAANGIDVGSQGNTGAISFTGGDQIFTAEHNSINFSDVEMTVQTTGAVQFRADGANSLITDGGSVSITAPAISADSSGDFTFNAENLVLQSEGQVNIHAENRINFFGNAVVLNGNGAGGTVNLNGGETSFDSDTLDIVGDTINFTSGGATTVTAADINLDADGSIYYHAIEDGGSITTAVSGGGEDLTAAGNIGYSSDARNDISFSASQFSFIVGPLGITGNNLDLVGRNIDVSSLFDVTHDTVTSTELYATAQVDVHADDDILITGTSVTFDFQDIQGDNDLSIGGNADYNACETVDIIVPEFTATLAGDYTVLQDVNLCTPPGTFGNFSVVAHAEDDLNLLAVSGIDFLGEDSIRVETTGINQAGGIRLIGGRAVDPLEYTAVFNSSTTISIDSVNEEIELRRAQDDRLDAPLGFINVDALDWIDFQANGHENNFNTQNFGIYIQTQEHPLRDSVTWNDADTPVISDIRFRAIDGEMQVTAGDLLRLGTFQPLPGVPADRTQNMNVRTTKDILLDAGDGALLLTAQGQTDPDDLDTLPDASITFHALENNISVNSALAALVFDGHAGTSFESLTSEVTFAAAHGISARTTGTDANLSYFSEFGVVNIDVQANDIAFHAGSTLQEADADFTSSREFILSSGQDQQYRSYGALNSEDQIGIHLVGDDGSITVTSAGDVEYYSSGSTRFDASTGVVDVTMNEDIFILSNARANFTAQFTSTVTVADGDIVIDANGGGGSVDIISDSNQDILGTAGIDISVTTANEAVYAAHTSITAITNTGDVTVTQRGDNQDTLVHSEGSVLLQADGQTGIRMAGRNVYADAVQDINVDSAAVNVGSTSNTNTATEPLIVIRAGGDSDTDGFNVDSVGNIDWDTSVASPVTFEANRINTDVGGDMSVLANGPIHYNAFGHLDDGLFTISAEGALDLDGEESVFVHGESTAFLSTAGSIDFEAIGTDNEDRMILHSSNNFFVSGRNGVGGAFEQTAQDLNAEFRDMDMIAGSVLMQNTPGNGGKFKFNSDTAIHGDSSGQVTFQASGEINVDTFGEKSDIGFNIAGAAALSSAGAVKASSGSFDLDSPEGVDVTANGGEISATASDDIIVIANSTYTATSRNTFTIEVGASANPTTTSQPHLNITSRGTADFVSVEDFDIHVTGDDTSLTVSADGDLVLQNSVPLRTRDQGDVTFTGANDIEAFTGRDFHMEAARDLVILNTGDDTTFTSNGDIAVSATAAGANVLIQSSDLIQLDSATESTIVAGSSSSVADFTITAEELFWEQEFEGGNVGGIRVAATGAGAPLDLTFEDVTVNADVGVLFTSAAGFGLFDAEGDIQISSVQDGADVVFESRNSDVIATALNWGHDAEDVGQVDAGVVLIEGTGNGSDQVPSVTLGATLSGQNDIATVDFKSERNMNIRSENRVVFDQSLGFGFSGAGFDFESDESILLRSNGIAPGNNPYGVLLEADQGVNIDADNDVRLHATGPGGVVSLTGSETVELNANTIEVLAGDTLNFYSGYTPPLNAALDERIAIEFIDDVSFRSTHRDIAVNAEDVSWTGEQGFSIRSEGPGSSVSFSTADTDVLLDVSDDVTVTAAGRLELVSGTALFVDASNDITLEAANSLTLTGSGQMDIDVSTMTVAADETILFLTETGVVDLQPNSFTATSRFYIPELDLRAGVGDFQYQVTYTPYWTTTVNSPYSGVGYGTTVYGTHPNTASYLDLYRPEEENQQAACENRQFGFDSNTHDMCFCQYGKWMCTRNKSTDFLNMGFAPGSLGPIIN